MRPGPGGAPRDPGCGRGAGGEAGDERDWAVSARARCWGWGGREGARPAKRGGAGGGAPRAAAG